jgi:NAD-dependent deacetylase sirtuin 2
MQSARLFSRTPARDAVQRIGNGLQSGMFKNVIVMFGAGVSVSAGIPDFRTPGTGLYDNLHKYNLPYAEAIFDIRYFAQNPVPFFQLAKELWPGKAFKPTLSHHFVKLLQDRKLLLSLYTQNIDGLERIAGITEDRLVEAHGSFISSTCQSCFKKFPGDQIRDDVFADKIPMCKVCLKGVVKPDITFFGEALPTRFHMKVELDFPECDLLLIMGTSLQVQPFAGLVHEVLNDVPRVLINREAVDGFGSLSRRRNPFLRRKPEDDMFLQGDCDQIVTEIAEAAGWKDDFLKIDKK